VLAHLDLHSDELEHSAVVVLDGRDREQVPERGAVFLVVEQPPAKTLPFLQRIPNPRNVIFIRPRTLQEPAVPAPNTLISEHSSEPTIEHSSELS
jgi:hypothetical protein